MTTPFCTICHGVYVQTEEIGTTPCGHVYHNQCLSEWFSTSETCPQCRKDCNSHQIKRIYIDSACDEDLACAQMSVTSQKANSDAEETIKILLEHIENGGNESKTPRKTDLNTCDLCKDFQEAYNEVLNEKDLIAETLKSTEQENRSLLEKYQRSVKQIEQLETKDRSQGECDSSDTKRRLEGLEQLEELLTHS